MPVKAEVWNGVRPLQQEKSDSAAELTGRVETGGIEVIERNSEGWQKLCDQTRSAPFYWPDWISTYLRVFEPASEVVLLSVCSGSELLAVLPLVRKRCRYAGVSLIELAGPANVHSVRFDVLCKPSPNGDAVIRELWKLLKSTPPWQMLALPTFSVDAACWKLMAVAAAEGYSTITLPYHKGPIVRLQTDEDGRLSWLGNTNRHFRHELRRYAHLLEAELGGKPSFICRTDPDPEILQKFFSLEASGWKGVRRTAIGCDPRTQAFYESIAHVLARRGRFRLYTLERKEEMIAGAFSAVTDDCVFPMKIGYDEALRRGGPGQVLFNGILAECAEKQIPELYFGGDQDRFKCSWTPETLPHFNGFVFSPDLRAQLAYRLSVHVLSPLRNLRRRTCGEPV
jgi:CelD/BcsL family acetyltransferase involved in cellulose biosynthesis